MTNPRSTTGNLKSIYDYMAIPDNCRLGKRVFKKLFHENAKLGATDRKAFREDIDVITWAYAFGFDPTSRCHKREFLLKFSKDRRRWLKWLFEAKKRYALTILNYNVTSNHIHLL